MWKHDPCGLDSQLFCIHVALKKKYLTTISETWNSKKKNVNK